MSRRPFHRPRAAPAGISPKVRWDPGCLLAPAPALLVSCRADDKSNLLTVAWAGIACSDPPTLAIAIRPERFSYGLIAQSGEFVANIPPATLARAVDLCGCISGRDRDKWAAAGLTEEPAAAVRAPLVRECVLHLECRVVERLALGSHTLFLGRIVAVAAAEALLDGKGRLALERAGLLAYAHGHYYALGRQLGHFGFSVRKKPRPKESRRS